MTGILERTAHRPEPTKASRPLFQPCSHQAPARPVWALRQEPTAGTSDEARHGHVGYSVPAHRVREFARLAARCGWDSRAVLAAAGIAPASLNQPCPGITVDQAVAVLRRLWAVTKDELLGLGPHPVARDTLRLLAFAISSAPTLGDALSRVEEFTPVFAGLPTISVSTGAGETTISIDLDGFDSRVSLIADSVLAVTHRIINWGTRQRIQLLRFDVPYQRPRNETDGDVIFGIPVRFNASRVALVFASNVLAAPLVRRPDEIESFLADIPTALLSEMDFYTSHTQRVRGIIEGRLGDRWCTADEIAAGMGISRQTLRRRLNEECTSVSAIRDDVLRTAALDSLSQCGESVSALACRLGFSEPSAFTRAFRRWTGESPTVYQRRQSAIN